MPRSSYLLTVILLGTLSAMPPISIDTVLPAIPEIAKSLAVDAGIIQLTIAAYVFGAAIGQVLIAPLSDRFGRRPILFAGLFVYIMAAFGCAYATSVEMLVALRFVQGASTYTGRILPRAIARDLYDREDAARLISYMMVFGGAAPILSPLIGAQLTNFFGWPSIFLFMAVYGVIIVLLTAVYLDETLPQERRIRVNPTSMIINFGRLVRHRSFVAYGACMVFTMGALMAFLASASSVVIVFLGGSTHEFAYAHGGVMIGYSLFGYLAARLVGRLGIGRLVAFGTVTGAICGLAMLALALAGVDTIWAIAVPMFGFMAAFSFVVPAATAGALSPFGDMAGSAMANLAFLQTCFSAAIAALAGLLFDGTQMPMVTMIAVLGVASLLAWLFLVRPLERRRAGV